MTFFLSLLVAGIVSGAIYAVSATGLVVTYSTTGVFNFAQGAMGMVLAFIFWQLWQGWNVNVIVSLVVTLLVVAPLMGALVERTLMRNLHGSPIGVSLVVTIGLLLLLFGLANAFWNQTVSRTLPNFLPNTTVRVFNVTISGEQLITIAVAVVAAVGLRLMYRHTRFGVAMRAVVDDPDLSSLTGASSARLSSVAWMIATMLAGIAGILLAPQTYMSIVDLTLLVIYSYSAAVVGRLKNLPMTVVGAMVLGISYSMATGYAPASIESYITLALPMGLLVLAVLVVPQARLSLARIPRPRLPRVSSARTVMAGSGALVALTVLFAFVLGADNLNIMGEVLVIALLALSMVPLCGYGGQVSLCQYTFLGLGCVVMAKVGGGDSLLGVLAAIGACAGAGAILALPALRLRGLYLGLLTLAFAYLMDNLFFTASWAMGNGGTLSVGRPNIFGVQFTSNRSFVILLGVILAVCLVGVGALRRSRYGRRLVGMSDSPAACTTVGLDLTKTRLLVFILSAGMAGLAGALYGGQQGIVSSNQFQFELSLAFFLSVMVSGASTLIGPMFVGIFLVVVPIIGSYFSWGSQLLYIAAGAGAFTIQRYPHGMPQAYRESWERVKQLRGPRAGPDAGLPSPAPEAVSRVA